MTPTIILRPGDTDPAECFKRAQMFIRDFPAGRIGISLGVGYGSPDHRIGWFVYRTPSGAVVVRGERKS